MFFSQEFFLMADSSEYYNTHAVAITAQPILDFLRQILLLNYIIMTEKKNQR